MENLKKNARKNRFKSGKKKKFELFFKKTNKHVYVILNKFNRDDFSICNIKSFSTQKVLNNENQNHVNKSNVSLFSNLVGSYLKENNIDFNDIYFNRNGFNYKSNTIIANFLENLINFCK